MTIPESDSIRQRASQEDTNKIRKESLPKEGENSSSIDSIADNSLTDVVSNSKDELQMDRRVMANNHVVTAM
uniref:Uncharacterized protein n=1 Tax=Daphnia galeata TaxID=27404 RepID=A0A8J2WIM3_9CRUS|nr:unnamed protein product [Daphnia galeata]